ncbi:hypothetical protein [Couchioplanes azureus]|uniref:hypothetical protein n=1 Tax=Couchioplanes caeruleus TaxID=56438 RepID=UPI00166FA43D|nr:hypothetical protein [Couchioplanes caeruleus]GGQ60182.1 hypothetical protein GCM10010166_32240 [Couchioplanes caeruleus subsp. azureus]
MPVATIRRATAAIAVLVLAGCGGGHSAGVRPSRAAPAATGADSTAQAAGTLVMPRTIACTPAEAHLRSTAPPSGADLVVGSLSWPGLRGWETADPADFNGGTGDDYKVGAVVRAGAVVTVSVPDPSDGKIGLKYGQGWNYEPARSVTFRGCPEFDTIYIGGFHVAGRRCVPLEITEGSTPPVRVTVSFFAGPC